MEAFYEAVPSDTTVQIRLVPKEHEEHEHHEHRRRTLKWRLGSFDEMNPADLPQRSWPGTYPTPRWEGTHDMSFTLKDNQEVTFGVSGKDAAGNDAPLTGTPTFAVDDSSILALTDNGDGSGKVSAQGKVGTATLSVTDSETNGRQFIGSVAIDVVAGDVASVAVSLGAPTDIQAAQPDQPVDPNAPQPVDPNAPQPVDPNAPQPVDPNAPTDGPVVNPDAPVDPNAPQPIQPDGGQEVV